MNSEPVYLGHAIGLQLIPHLSRFVDHPIVYRPWNWPRDPVAVIGWGLKGRSLKSLAYARRHGLPYLALEDGFLRSVQLGDVDGPLSVVMDDVGIYYDATAPSRLESLIAAPHEAAQLERAADVRAAWCAGRVSKYNHAREAPPPVAGRYVLAIDQTAGDASIHYGLASADSFVRMVEAALDENPGATVVLKVHPDVIAGRKASHVGHLTAGQAGRVRLLATNAHPPSLLAGADAVYVVTSQVGFEALLWGRPVRTFGMPFYAGWGLTTDELERPQRRVTSRTVTLDDVAHAALVEYPRYLDPETLERGSVERLLEWMTLQRRMRERFPTPLQAIGFSTWKRPIASLFLAGSDLQFLADGLADETLPSVSWGRRDPPPTDAGAPVRIQIEDGFLRSVGLGATFTRPLSLVADRMGVYYDATRVSELEWLLQNTAFDPALIERARRLRERIVARGLTKYNVGSRRWTRPPDAARVVLVPGQVESDASIAYGCSGVRSNWDLVQAARQRAPDAFLVYKPHPDVVAGKRQPGAHDDRIVGVADAVVVDVPMHELLAACDEVHVMTSLTGFEALMRNKAVTCHGHPFFAGWGLTVDVDPLPRRTRRLTLDELVAGTLILYPTYVSRTTDAYTTPERVLDELSDWNAVPREDEAWFVPALRWAQRWRNRWRRRQRRSA